MQHMKGTEGAPSLTEVLNTWRLLPATPKRVHRSREFVSLEPEENKLWEQEQDRAEPVLWCVWRGVKADWRKKPQLKKCQWVQFKQLHLTHLQEADKQQASLPVFWHYFLVSSSLSFITPLLIEVWFDIYIVLHYSNPEQTLDCFMSWNCSEITGMDVHFIKIFLKWLYYSHWKC